MTEKSALKTTTENSIVSENIMKKAVDKAAHVIDKIAPQIQLLNTACNYLLETSLPGSGVPTDILKNSIGPYVITNAAKFTGQFEGFFYSTRGKRAETKTNEMLVVQEGVQGIGNSIHEQGVELTPNLDWHEGTYHPQLAVELAKHLFKPHEEEKSPIKAFLSKKNRNRIMEWSPSKEQISQAQLYLKYKEQEVLHDPNLRRYSSLEPIITATISGAIEKYKNEYTPSITPNKDDKQTLVWGKSEKLSLERAVRLVVPSKEGDGYYFADLPYKTYLGITHDSPSLKAVHAKSTDQSKVTLFSQLLLEGVNQKDIENLSKKNLKFYKLDDWFKQKTSIVTISAQKGSDSPIEGGENPAKGIFDARSPLAVNIEVSDLTQLVPTIYHTMGSHQATTAVPITDFIENQILPLANIKDTNTPNPSFTKLTNLKDIPIFNKSIASFAPNLAAQQANLLEQSFSQEGASALAALCNINEVQVTQPIPEGYAPLITSTKKLYDYLNENNPELFPLDALPSVSDYTMMACLSEDGVPIFLSIEPNNPEKLPNALEMGIMGNISAEAVKELTEQIEKYITLTAEFTEEANSNTRFRPLQASGLVAGVQNSFTQVAEAQKLFAKEVARCKASKGTVGLFARSAGPARDPLTTTSNRIAPEPMRALSSEVQVSPLGKTRSGFKGKVVNWHFITSLSRTVNRGIGTNSQEFSLRSKVFEDNLLTMKILDQYGDTDIFNGMLESFQNLPLDRHDRIVIEWLKNNTKQIKLNDPIITQQSYEKLYAELINQKSILNLETYFPSQAQELELANYLRSIMHDHEAHDLDYDWMTPKQQKIVSRYIYKIAELSGGDRAEIMHEYQNRVKQLSHGIWDFNTSNDKTWAYMCEEFAKVSKQYQENVSALAKARATDVNVKNIGISDPQVSPPENDENLLSGALNDLDQSLRRRSPAFTNLDSFIENSRLDAYLKSELQTIADRVSHALTEYLNQTESREVQIQSLINIANLLTIDKAQKYLTKSVSLASMYHAQVLSQVITRMYQTAKVEVDHEVRNRTPEQEQLLLEHIQGWYPELQQLDFDSPTDLMKLCIRAKESKIRPSSVTNYLFTQAMERTHLQEYLQAKLDPETGIELNRQAIAEQAIIVTRRTQTGTRNRSTEIAAELQTTPPSTNFDDVLNSLNGIQK